MMDAATTSKHDNEDDCNKFIDNNVQNNTTTVSTVTQVNTATNSSSDHAASSIAKYAITVDIAIRDMGLATGVKRENSSMMMLQP